MLPNQWHTHVSMQIFIQAKNQTHLILLTNPLGIKAQAIANNTGFSMLMIHSCLEELYIEDLAYFDNRNGRWFAENDI